MKPPSVCNFCKREFATYSGLGQHFRHVSRAIAKGRRNRLCPDRRDDTEARETALLQVRLKSKLGLLGRQP